MSQRLCERAAPARRAAQAAVEFGLVLPIVLVLIAGTIEFGRGLFAYNQLLQGAQEGARYGAVLGNAQSDTAIINRAQQIVPGGALDSVTVSASVSATDATAVTVANRKRGNALTVGVTHTHNVLTPFYPGGTIRMAVSASMVIE